MAGLGSDPYGMEAQYFNGQRKRRKLTKEDHMLGVFGESNNRQGRRQEVDYTRGVGFVRGGVVTQDDEDKPKPPPQKKQQQRGGNRSRRSRPPAPEPTSGFEKHTKGIGSKLMAMMGYKPGEGLGPKGNGIRTAIEVKVRPKNLGLGNMQEATHQFEEHFAAKRGETLEKDGADDSDEEMAEAPQNWRRSKPKRVKVKYKTAQDLEEKRDAPRLVIHDMTGPSARVVTNASQLNTPASRWTAPTGTFMPELKYNMRMLVDMKENQIRNLYYQEGENTKRQSIAKEETQQLKANTIKEERRITALKGIIQMINKIKVSNTLSLADLEKFFAMLTDRYKEEYKRFRLSSLAHAVVVPVIRSFMSNWNPLTIEGEDPTAKVVGKWKRLLWPSQDDFAEDKDPYNTYNYIIFYIVLPRMRQIFLGPEWSAKQPEACTRTLDSWSDVMGLDATEYFKTTVIMPKIETQVNNWNPLVDRVPIHQWMHQYLPFFGVDRFKHLWATIRQYLSVCLQKWHPSDSTALTLLAPWKKVFSDKDMEVFLIRAIIPKLILAMREFHVNPKNQQLDQFNWVMAWKDVVPSHHMATLLNNEFFPKWFKALHTWLTHGNADFGQLTQWYLNWKSQIPTHIVEEKAVQNAFNSGLLMMNEAVAGRVPALPQFDTAQPFIPLHQKRSDNTRTAKAYVPTMKVTLKEMLQSIAQENDLLCVPTGRRHQGKQIFKFGRVPIIIEDNVVYTQQNNAKWDPTSIDALVSMNKM